MARMAMERKHYLCATVATEESGSLNPDWVEWLMGYPIGHTALGASETRLFLKSRKSSPE
jgi:hypothetical protein